jgi:hypothetical protein
MAAILLPFSPTRQPANPKANLGSQLLVGASGLWSFGHGARNLLNGESVVLSGGATWEAGPKGNSGRVYASGASAGTSLIQLAADSSSILPTSGGFTIALHYRKTDTTARNTGGFGLNIVSDVVSRAGAHFPWSDGTVYFDYGNQTAGFRLSIGGLTFGDHFWVFTTGPRGMEIWQNGVKRASNADNPSRTGTTQPYYIGNHANVGSDNAESSMAVVLKRQWATAEIVQWFQNPWQLFEPLPRRIFIGEVAGGPTTFTATATLDAAIQEAKTATATLDAAIRQTNTTSATLDGVIATRNTATVTLDAAIQQAVTATVTLDGAIQAAMSATSTLDAVIQTAGVNTYTATVTLDAAIREAKTLTATLDAAIQITNTSTVTLDARIVSVNTATATLDATILQAVTAYALLDAYIFDADAPVVEVTTGQTPAGRPKRDMRRRYVMPDDTVILATPTEAEQLVKLFVKPKPVRASQKAPKRVVKELKAVDLVEIEPVYSDTVHTEKITVKKKAVWDVEADLYVKAMRMMAERELKRRRYEEELILLSA